mgnify:CR=1 FL=1
MSSTQQTLQVTTEELGVTKVQLEEESFVSEVTTRAVTERD